MICGITAREHLEIEDYQLSRLGGVITAARTLVPQLPGSILEHTKQGNKRRCCSSRKTKPNGHKMLETPELFLKEDGTTCETSSSNSIRPE
ncbi:hypothetical protein TNCT_640671 [Trichonephila clavata]|uniref:Uncharacterized protein n=1 Tax=Trichonephila clavata TaxID=2740835 RepID=A0A8X6JBX5_TRICU|nr:hypothetical protein TNCT_640671 [Trichonephila clavata]